MSDNSCNYVFFDTETTSLKYPEIIQIAARDLMGDNEFNE